MNKYSFKPLILLVFCILALVFLLGAERYSKKNESINTDPVSEKNTSGKDKKKESKVTKDKPSNEDKGSFYGNNPVKVLLAVGTCGSLQEGGFARIYEEPDEASLVVGKLQYNCTVKITEDYDDEWYSVDVSGDGDTGYVKKENCKPVEISIGSADPVRDKIVKKAYSYLGLPFKRYGKSLEVGVDCSNFIQQIYKLYGFEIPNRPLEQRDYGKPVKEEEALPGDMVYYDKANDGTGHVAIYLGDGMMINSSGHSGQKYPQGGVRICCLLYKDRDSYQLYNLLDAEGQESDGQ